MSLQFNDTTNKQGILQKIERLCKFNDAGITGNTQRLKDFTADINLALDTVLAWIFQAGGRWQFDDSNHTDHPFIETDLVANQRDYSFTTDEQGNLILDVFKVMVKGPDGIYFEIYPVDQQSDADMASFYSGLNTTGTPSRYDKTGNAILLDCIPSYSWRIGTELERGLKVFINRGGSYFSSTDTTKKPGFAGLYHKILALIPSYEYAYTNGLANKNDIKAEMVEMEVNIKKHYRDRNKDEVPVISGEQIDSV